MLQNFLKQSVICIDIGYRNIKVVEVIVGKNNEISVENFGIVSTPHGCIKNGCIANVPVVLNALRELIRARGMKSKVAKIIMSGTNIITRIFLIDKIIGDDYDEAIKESMPKYLPVNADEYSLSYKILQTVRERGGEKLKVFMTAVPKNILKSYVEVLYGLGLKPASVDIPANSIAKFFNRDVLPNKADDLFNEKYVKGDPNAFAVFDFGSETTIVNFIKDKVLEFNKVILAGSSNIDEHISRRLKVPIDEAERIKKIYGMLPSVDPDNRDHMEASVVISEYVDKLTSQIVKCLEFYLERLYGTEISRVYIIGGGSLLSGLSSYLTSVFQIPVYPLSQLDIKGIKLKSAQDKERLIYLVNAIGISL